MSLFDTEYNSGGTTNNNSGNDYEERDSLKLDKYGIVSFEISRLGEYTGSQFGQSLIVDADDLKVHDGIVMDRDPNDPEDDTKKVFGYQTWFATDGNGRLDEDIDSDDIPGRHAESFGSNDFSYKLLDAVTEEDTPIDMGNMTMWLSNSTKNRTFAKVVTPDGHDVVDDKEDDFNWLDTDEPELRSDLEGRRVILFYKDEAFTPDGEDEEIEYTDAVVLDEDSRAGITIQNGSSDSSSSSSNNSSSDTAETSGGSVGGDDNAGSDLPDGVPSELESIIGFMARTDQTDHDDVVGVCENETDAEFDADAVIAEIESRQ